MGFALNITREFLCSKVRPQTALSTQSNKALSSLYCFVWLYSGMACVRDKLDCAKTKMGCEPDCHRDQNGTAWNNECELCVGGNTGLKENTGMDCSETCGGSAFVDACGIWASDEQTFSEIDGAVQGQIDFSWYANKNDALTLGYFTGEQGCIQYKISEYSQPNIDNATQQGLAIWGVKNEPIFLDLDQGFEICLTD